MQAMQQFFGACAFLIIATGVFLAVQTGKIQAGSVADWAAAFGSGGAVLFTWWQTRKTLEAALDQKRDFVNSVSDTVDIAPNELYPLRVAIRDRDPLEFLHAHGNLRAAPQRAFDAILAVGVEKWPSAILYVRARTLWEAIEELVRFADANYRNAAGTSFFFAPTEIEHAIREAQAEFRQSLAAIPAR